MTPRLRPALTVGVLAALLGSSAAAATAPAHRPPTRTESCGYGTPPSSRPPTAPPPTRPWDAGCVAEPTSTGGGTGSQPGGGTGGSPEDATGYHHLGALTNSGWAGVLGEVTVRHTGVRPNSEDFVATRFMARGDTGGQTRWLEVGWSEAGWQPGGPRLYTYDTNRNQWAYYNQYQLTDGMPIWLALDSNGATERSGSTWDAWLWWNNQWNLLTSQQLPIPASTNLEQFVEVYDDPQRAGGFAVPPVRVDDVELDQLGGDYQPWSDDVDTQTNPADPGYCLDWRTRYDAWTAGTGGC